MENIIHDQILESVLGLELSFQVKIQPHICSHLKFLFFHDREKTPRFDGDELASKCYKLIFIGKLYVLEIRLHDEVADIIEARGYIKCIRNVHCLDHKKIDDL